MGFSGGGSNITKPHTHDSTIVQDGGSLAANVTQFGLSAGSILYSDGSNIQELGVGSASDALVVNGAGTAPEWGTGGGTTYAAKVRTTDDSVTNDTTLTNDDTLIIALAANKSYFFQCTMFVNANASGDFKYDFSSPAGSGGAYINTTPNGMAEWQATVSLSTATDMNTPSSGTDGSFCVYGRVDTAGTADNFALRWCQVSSEPVATYLLKGSSLVMWEG